MIRPKMGFIVYGVHKDGLEDPLGTPFIDEHIIKRSKEALRNRGVELVEYDLVIASKEEARECFRHFKRNFDVDGVILFSGTWVWAAHLIGAVRDYAATGKGVLLWTHPGSRGWRPVGGLVMQAACKEIGINHRFVYGPAGDEAKIQQILSYSRASALKNKLNMSTIGAVGGRGMGQTCGVADPSQWMKMFGVDIDSRDTTELMVEAKNISEAEIKDARKTIQPLFSEPVPENETADKSIRVYLALKKLCGKHQWDMYTIQSFPGIGDLYSATCFAQSMMLNDGVATSTLGDFNTAMTARLLMEFSEEPVYYGDLQHVDTAAKEIKIIGDGACPPSLAGDLVPAKFAEHGIPTEGEAGGLSVELVCKPGKGALARLGRTEGEFQLLFCRCTVFEPSAGELEKRRSECGIPFWPHAFIRVEGDMEKLLQGWNNEYAVLGYGENIFEDLKSFCEIMGIDKREI